MSVIVGVLAVLAISLLVLAILIWAVNSKVMLPEIVDKVSVWSLSADNIGSYLEVLTGIVALLFPISLSIISDAKGKYFSSQEVTSVVFEQCEYKGLYYVLSILVVLTFASFWDPLPKWFVILMLSAMTGSLGFLFFFFRKLEKIISDFSQLVRHEEKSNINKLLRNGKNQRG
ncbi:hypothetical protein J2X69_000410 [Algoriphagus sp. 4150]|uniref:hypothetical protein n=1 Tax=Algoriphagus sp. 4150 TaxID=2817756 RepID=UPI0028575053|nr:hypothetical protein [Algoriphagus sp. 4150]MDR7128082.1 hypothetical protein [Algoriphagus sp. 4150]